MAPTDRDNMSFEDDPAPGPELDALAECLRREASELSAMYPPGSAQRVPLDHLVPTRKSPRRRLLWGLGAAVAVMVVSVATWTVTQPDSVPQVADPNPRHALQAIKLGMDDVHTPAVWTRQPPRNGIPVLPASAIGAHDMNGPEIEAVLILLEDNKSSLKLAL